VGAISVDSRPGLADVRLDGHDLGRSTPTTFMDVAPGMHHISVAIPGFRTWDETVTVTGGATTDVVAPLLVGLPPTASADVTVTTTSDAINGDVTSIATLKANPGPDGVSLREAISASNETTGMKVVRFDPTMHDAIVMVGASTGQPLPILTGGGTWIIGDIDGDGTPDVTLDGHLGQVAGGPLSNGITIWSSGNAISGLRFADYVGGAVSFSASGDWTGPSKTIADDWVLGNTIESSGGVSIGPLGWVGPEHSEWVSNLTWSSITIAGNRVTGGSAAGIVAYAGSSGVHDNQITGLTIASNDVVGICGISVTASDANSAWHHLPGPILYADHNALHDIVVAHNRCSGALYKGIEVRTANFGNSDNTASDVLIQDNDISFVGPFGNGIILDAGDIAFNEGERATARNRLTHVEVRRNRIQDAQWGILFSVGEDTRAPGSTVAGGATEEVASDVVIADNDIRNSTVCGISATAGMAYAGASPCRDTTLTGLVISGNVLTNGVTQGLGIRLSAGTSSPEGAQVTGNDVIGALVQGNTIRGFATGIWIAGGYRPGAVGNRLTGSSSGNSIIANEPWRIVANSDGATANTVSFNASDRLVRPVVGTPRAPSTMSHSRYYTIYGYLKPRHTSGSYPVRIYKYRYVSGHWRSYGYTLAKASNYYSYTKYSRSIRLPYTGKWKVRAYAPADSGHLATWSSGYDYITVK
jgi:hypothetical protein